MNRAVSLVAVPDDRAKRERTKFLSTARKTDAMPFNAWPWKRILSLKFFLRSLQKKPRIPYKKIRLSLIDNEKNFFIWSLLE